MDEVSSVLEVVVDTGKTMKADVDEVLKVAISLHMQMFRTLAA